jgi:hypothetical protein
MKTIKVKISQFVDIPVTDNASEDETYRAVDNYLAPMSVNRRNLDFVVESVNDDFDHFLVDEIVGN